MTVRAFRRYTRDVGRCNACTNPASDEVTVIGCWPQGNQGVETRYCDGCLADMLAAAITASKKPARHTSSISGTAEEKPAKKHKDGPSARPDLQPQGVIARKAAHVKPRVYPASNGKAKKPVVQKRTKPFPAKKRVT
jgi:hypothetical protein